ncbi:hypothetical protein J3E69DRAFT_348873 [Trichoderma sp. SZMC 28015]
MCNPNYIDTLLSMASSITDASNGLTRFKQIIGIRSQSTNLFQDYLSECKYVTPLLITASYDNEVQGFDRLTPPFFISSGKWWWRY